MSIVIPLCHRPIKFNNSPLRGSAINLFGRWHSVNYYKQYNTAFHFLFFKYSILEFPWHGLCQRYKNKTNHPISSNSHPSATAKWAIFSLKIGGGSTKPTGTSYNFDSFNLTCNWIRKGSCVCAWKHFSAAIMNFGLRSHSKMDKTPCCVTNTTLEEKWDRQIHSVQKKTEHYEKCWCGQTNCGLTNDLWWM